MLYIYFYIYLYLIQITFSSHKNLLKEFEINMMQFKNPLNDQRLRNHRIGRQPEWYFVTKKKNH